MVPAPIKIARKKRMLDTRESPQFIKLLPGRFVQCTQTLHTRQEQNELSTGTKVLLLCHTKLFSNGQTTPSNSFPAPFRMLLKYPARVQNSCFDVLWIDHFKHHVIADLELAHDRLELIAASRRLLVHVGNHLARFKLLHIGK